MYIKNRQSNSKNQGYGLVSNFVFIQKFFPSKSPTFYILDVVKHYEIEN
jgi:hypothetical protein